MTAIQRAADAPPVIAERHVWLSTGPIASRNLARRTRATRGYHNCRLLAPRAPPRLPVQCVFIADDEEPQSASSPAVPQVAPSRIRSFCLSTPFGDARLFNRLSWHYWHPSRQSQVNCRTHHTMCARYRLAAWPQPSRRTTREPFAEHRGLGFRSRRRQSARRATWSV